MVPTAIRVLSLGTALSTTSGRVLLAALLMAAAAARGASAAEDQAKVDSLWARADSVWVHQLVGGLNLSQVALKDWAGGGDDALAWTAAANGQADRARAPLRWSTQYRLAFGQTKLGDGGVRKTDDKIDLSTTLTYLANAYVNPYVAATLKTQFARGFDYGGPAKVAVSQFFDPAYLTQTTGVGYQPLPQLKTRLGAGLREILTRDFTGYSDDDATSKVEKTKVDAGMESVTEAAWQLAQNVLLTSKLEIFAPVAELDMTSVRNDTNVNLKLNEYISTNLNLQAVKDKSASPDLQTKEALALGLSYTFM